MKNILNFKGLTALMLILVTAVAVTFGLNQSKSDSLANQKGVSKSSTIEIGGNTYPGRPNIENAASDIGGQQELPRRFCDIGGSKTPGDTGGLINPNIGGGRDSGGGLIVNYSLTPGDIGGRGTGSDTGQIGGQGAPRSITDIGGQDSPRHFSANGSVLNMPDPFSEKGGKGTGSDTGQIGGKDSTGGLIVFTDAFMDSFNIGGSQTVPRTLNEGGSKISRYCILKEY